MGQYLFSIASKIPGASPDLLGGKGYGLNKMKLAGIPVPPAYVITTEACRDYMKNPAEVMAKVESEIIPTIIAGLSEEFGYMPLVSVRSGAKFSMPGMMDTILNVGLDSNVQGEWLKRLPTNCVKNSYERLVEMYGSVVKGVERKKFEGKNLAERLLFYKLEAGEAFPEAGSQLLGAIEAVFKSWNNERAKTYRKLNNIPDDLGTAVVVQAMVFGNMNDKSCTGVLFTRNPSSGENEIVGEFLVNAQGEDVVAGIRTPDPLTEMAKWNAKSAAELQSTVEKLEKMNRDMQDVEFTVQDGELFILQTRSAKRTAQAAVRVAVDLTSEGLISIDEAIERVSLRQFLAATRPVIPANWKIKNPALGKGISASNGCASGVAVFSSSAAINCNKPCILITEETTPDDIGGMNASVGILTSTGGLTSHAAVVARGMDKVCVVGCTELQKKPGKWVLNGKAIKEGETKVTIDGSTGEIWVGEEVPVEGGTNNGMVSLFASMLEKKFSIYRTVTSSEEMKNADRLLVATYLMDRQYNGAALESAMIDLLGAIGDREAVIDLRAVQDVTREADTPVEFMWGELNTPLYAVNFKIASLNLMKKQGALANAKVLEAGLAREQIAVLKKNGFVTIPIVTKFSEIATTKGLCMPDFEKLIEEVGKSKVQEAVAAKKAKGEMIRSFNIVQEVEADILLRGMAFAMSPMQTAQCLLKGDVA